MSPRKRDIGSWLLILSAACWTSCSKQQAEPQPVVSVQVTRAEKHHLTQVVRGDAVLFPIKQAAITPKIAAPVRKFLVNRGDRVREGQLLAILENNDITASVVENRGALEQAQAGYTTATKAGIPEEVQKAELDVAQAKQSLDAQTKLLESRKMLFEQGALPRKDYDQAQVAYVQAKAQYDIAARHLASLKAVSTEQSIKAAKAQLTQAEGKYQGAEANLTFTEIRSPIAGLVTDRPNYAGEMPASGTPLITVMDTSSIIAKAHIPHAEAQQVRVGDAATLEVAGLEERVDGKVTVVSPALDPNSTTVEVWITAKNPQGALKPGSAAKIRIVAKETDAIAVPTNSLVKTEEGKQELAVVQDNVAHLREVETGTTDAEAGLTEIVSGLKPGEAIVTNAYGLPDNTKVKLESQNPGQSEKGGK